MADSEALEKYLQLKERIDLAAGAKDRCKILPVTKTVPAERIVCLREAGVMAIGENRVQEALQKREALGNLFEIDVIGRLQTNKAAQAAQFARMVQSLDRWELAVALEKALAAKERKLDVLVQVNIGKDPAKAGIMEEDAEAFLDRLTTLSHLRIKGLMTIAPITETPEGARVHFRNMRKLFDRLRAQRTGEGQMEILSMGMSADCVIAAQEGATLVRVGSALFGRRV